MPSFPTMIIVWQQPMHGLMSIVQQHDMHAMSIVRHQLMHGPYTI